MIEPRKLTLPQRIYDYLFKYMDPCPTCGHSHMPTLPELMEKLEQKDWQIRNAFHAMGDSKTCSKHPQYRLTPGAKRPIDGRGRKRK